MTSSSFMAEFQIRMLRRVVANKMLSAKSYSSATATTGLTVERIQCDQSSPVPTSLDYTVTSNGGPLYKHQATMPRLPVPPLQETLQKYLQTVEPLLSERDPAALEKTRQLVKEFGQPGGEGERLHAFLEKRIKEKQATSWFIDWWNDAAYMAYRDPVVVYVSYFFHFKDEARPRFRSQVGRAASLIRGALDFRQLVVSEKLEPETMKDKPLCSFQYKYLFHACRYPVMPSDTARAFDPLQHRHIVVVRKNKFYAINVLDSQHQPLSTADIQLQLERIVQLAGEKADEDAIGALTSDNRDVWAHSRGHLISLNPQNERALRVIETAAFLVCLDDTAPVTHEEVGRALWAGDGQNRFYDKSLQFIVFANGKAGFLGEHSMMDATPTHRLCEYVLDALANDKVQHGPEQARSSLPLPESLTFDVDAATRSHIQSAKQQFAQHLSDHEISILVYEGYGKDAIKKWKLSPDAFAQQAMQLAHAKLRGDGHKSPVATYESSTTRGYAYGRTEVTRTATKDSVAFVRAMLQPNTNWSARGEALRRAIGAHTRYMAEATEARGVDRHLMGLRKAAEALKMPKPALFLDPSFALSCHWTLSTSQISSEYYNGYGWSEVVPDGFGIPYMINSNVLQFHVCGRRGTHPHRMTHYLRESLDEMRRAAEASLPLNDAKSKAKL